MIKIPENLRVGDVDQWLNGGYVLHLTTGAPLRYLHVSDADEETGAAQSLYVFTSLPEEKYFVIPIDEVACFWPMCGALNSHQNFATYVRRMPSRQYRRTYNSRVLEVSVPQRWEVIKQYGAVPINADDTNIVREAFSPSYPSYPEAQAHLSSAISVAITPHIILAGDSDTHKVYVRGTLTGEISGGRLTVTGHPRTGMRLLKYFDGRVIL